MAEELLKYYKFMKDNGGFEAQIKLAVETKIPSTKAALAPDSPENIRVFRDAIQKISGKTPPW